jgi:hypothetical protein
MTAAAPAVYAKEWAEGRLSKALAEFAVVPTTWRSARLTSARAGLTGERSGACLKNGEGDGLSLMPAPRVGLIILELFGVSDIASSKIVVEKDGGSSETCQHVMASACLVWSRNAADADGDGHVHIARSR